MKSATRKTPTPQKVRTVKPNANAGTTIRQAQKQAGENGNPKKRK